MIAAAMAVVGEEPDEEGSVVGFFEDELHAAIQAAPGHPGAELEQGADAEVVTFDEAGRPVTVGALKAAVAFRGELESQQARVLAGNVEAVAWRYRETPSADWQLSLTRRVDLPDETQEEALFVEPPLERRLGNSDRDLLDTLIAVLNVIGYTEEFAMEHPALRVSEGVRAFIEQEGGALHAAAAADSKRMAFLEKSLAEVSRDNRNGEDVCRVVCLDEPVFAPGYTGITLRAATDMAQKVRAASAVR
jgi:hypothetical protein